MTGSSLPYETVKLLIMGVGEGEGTFAAFIAPTRRLASVEKMRMHHGEIVVSISTMRHAMV